MSTTISAGTATSGAALSSDTSGILQLQSGSTPTTAVTIDTSGRLLVGGTTATNGGFNEFFFNGSTYNGLVLNDTTATSGVIFEIFSANGTGCGAISRVGATSAVTYGTTSDRRLKSNITDITNSGTFIDALKPRNFTWTEANVADQGFIADEFQQVVPLAVRGEPNAVDKDGKPEYQSIEASSAAVIANLIAEVQFLRKRVATLENKAGVTA